MKKYILVFIIIAFFILRVNCNENINNQFTIAIGLFNKGKYIEAIKLYNDIIKSSPNTFESFKAGLEILKCYYYEWDLNKAGKFGEELLQKDEIKIKDYCMVKFDIYIWLITIYKAMNDNEKIKKIENDLVVYYENNIYLLTDERVTKAYERIKNRIKK